MLISKTLLLGLLFLIVWHGGGDYRCVAEWLDSRRVELSWVVREGGCRQRVCRHLGYFMP